MKKIISYTTISALALVPAVTFAASPFLKPVKDLLGDLEIFINFLNWAIPAVAVLAFFFGVAYFIWKKARGEDADKGILVWGVVGLAVMFTVYGLIQLLGSVVGIDTNRSKTITAPSLPQTGGTSRGGFYTN